MTICVTWFCLYNYLDPKDILNEGILLSSLLHFITGESVIPPMGLQHPIELQYHPAVETAIFLGTAPRCFSPSSIRPRKSFLQHASKVSCLEDIAMAMHSMYLMHNILLDHYHKPA